MRRKVVIALLVLVSMLFIAACETEPDTLGTDLQNEVVGLREDFNAFSDEWATFQEEWGTFQEGFAGEGVEAE